MAGSLDDRSIRSSSVSTLLLNHLNHSLSLRNSSVFTLQLVNHLFLEEVPN